MKKKIAILHAQIPFVRGGAEIMVNKLLENLELAGYDTELIKLPFRWYPENAFYDSMLIWDMLDFTMRPELQSVRERGGIGGVCSTRPSVS